MAGTQTKERQRQAEAPREAENKGSVAILRDPRLPYPPEAYELFGVDMAQWLALVEARFPLAKTSQAVFLALSWCKMRKLDVMKGVCSIVPMWNSALNREVETVWPGIAEVRITAHRTGCYAGADETVFGPTVDTLFEDTEKDYQKKDGTKVKGSKLSVRLAHPEWAQITVHRVMGNGFVAKFVGPKTYFREWYSGTKGLKVPNARWQRAPWQMLEKCTEAAALRKAFPEELGGEYTAEEMEGKVIDEDGAEVTAPDRPKRGDFKTAPGPVTDVHDEPAPEPEREEDQDIGHERHDLADELPPADPQDPGPAEDEPKSPAAEAASKRKPSFWELDALSIPVKKDAKGHDDLAAWASLMGNATRDCPSAELLGRLERENKAAIDQLCLKLPQLGQALRMDFKAAAERLAKGRE